MNRQLFNAMAAQYATPEVSGSGLVSWENGKKCEIPSVKLYGAAVQDGTPVPDAPVMPVCNNGLFRAADADGVYDGGQARAPELWAIPGAEYQDEWDCQTGWGIRRCSVRILDGTEDWTKNGSAGADGSACFWVPNPGQIDANVGICSHFKAGVFYVVGCKFGERIITAQRLYFLTNIDTVDDWKAWLAEQYAAGTPLTVVYPLAALEIFAAPAKLTMPNGCGQIVQTGGDVANCPITVKYLKHS